MLKQMRFGRSKEIYGVVFQPEKADPNVLIVSFPGLGQAMSEKNYLFSYLRKQLSARDYRFIQFDSRGCGDSAGDLGSADLTSMTEDAMEVLKHAAESKLPRKVIMIGHGLGSVVALKTIECWRALSNVPCIPVLISPILNPLPSVRSLIGEETLDLLKRSKYLDSKILFPGDDYYGYSDFRHEHLEFVSRLGAHMLYLHGQCLSYRLLTQLEELEPKALLDIAGSSGHLVMNRNEPKQLLEAMQYPCKLHALPELPYYRHPGTMDRLLRLLEQIVFDES